MTSELEDFSTRDSPPWDAEMACEDLESAHEGFLANGCVLVDVEAVPLPAVDGATAVADLVPQFISSYVHFGRSGPPSPWPGILVEGCYLDFCPDDCAMSLTFACSSPFSSRMGEVPTSVGLLHQARCIQVSVDCRLDVDGAAASAEADRGARNAPAWSGHVGAAVRAVASALRHMADAPSGMRFDYPEGVPRDLADKVSGGTDDEAADAAGILLANGFMAVVFYGDSMAPGPAVPA